MSFILPIQEFLRPELPTVRGCADYAEEKRHLERVDHLLVRSGVEKLFLELSMDRFERRIAGHPNAHRGNNARERHLRQSRLALRCTVLKHLTQQDYRGLSASLARAPLYRWFCGCPEFAEVRVPGKSRLREYAHWLEEEEMEKVLAALVAALRDDEQARAIGLEMEMDMVTTFVDTTCVQACAHFPTDWVLLRDAVRTLVKCIVVIRRHGLLKRIPEPERFLREMNVLAMGMSAAARRKAGAKKERKKWLRSMKKHSRLVESHARRYRAALDEEWEQTDLTRKEAERILRRMDGILEKLPEARRQAHERIIAGRSVPNEKKILSLYEPEIHVIVRGKAGKEVEFGNSLFLAESEEGLIVDHELRRDQSPGDAKWLGERFGKIRAKHGETLCGVIADRGFSSRATTEMLEEADLFNGICPKDPKKLTESMKDETFSGALRRRAQTEGRVAIFKNVFLGGIPRAKGFANRQMQVSWAVLTHNLWLVARRRWKADAETKAKAA
jgi:IS5 family transposase